MFILNWLITALLVIASLLLHEWAHVFAVRFMGGKIEKVGFFPLGMMARARRLEQLCGWERYVIYAAGPAVNFAVALWAGVTSHMSYVGVGWLERLAFYNFVLGVFNLMPAMPLDGGRIVCQFLGNCVGILRANRFVQGLGVVMGWFFVVLGFVQVVLFPFNVTLLCAGLYVLRANKEIKAELAAAFHLALDGKNSPGRSRTMPVKDVSISAETPVKQAMERIAGDYFIRFIIDNQKDRPLREQALMSHIFKNGLSGTVGEIY